LTRSNGFPLFFVNLQGGVIIGYIGDVSGRKKALEISLFLMAGATTLMGCLPTYGKNEEKQNPSISAFLLGSTRLNIMLLSNFLRSNRQWGYLVTFDRSNVTRVECGWPIDEFFSLYSRRSP
jgi:MFS family permease